MDIERADWIYLSRQRNQHPWHAERRAGLQAVLDEVEAENRERIENAEDEIEKAYTALGEIRDANPLRGDLDAYFAELAEWGMGKIENKPDPKDFGMMGS